MLKNTTITYTRRKNKTSLNMYFFQKVVKKNSGSSESCLASRTLTGTVHFSYVVWITLNKLISLKGPDTFGRTHLD